MKEEKFSGIKIEFDKPLETEDIAFTLRGISSMIDEGCKSGIFSWGVSWYLLKEKK